MLKQRWFWVDTKPTLFFCYTNSLSTSNQSRQVNIDEFPRHFEVLCCCNFDGRMTDVILQLQWFSADILWKFPSIFSKLQVYENIHEGFSFSITLNTDFCNNDLLQIFSLVESWFIEIWVLLPVTLLKELMQVRFLVISRTNTL